MAVKTGDRVIITGQSIATPRKGQIGILVAIWSRVYDHPYRIEFPDGSKVGFMRKEFRGYE